METKVKEKTKTATVATGGFQYVSYLWDDAKAASLAGDEVALLVYRSNLLGADPRRQK